MDVPFLKDVFELFGKDAVRVITAAEFIALVVLFRRVLGHAKEVAALRDSFENATAALRDGFESKLEKIHAGELVRAVKMETTMRGTQELVEGLLSGAVKVRRGKPVTNPGLDAGLDAANPTLQLQLPPKAGEGGDGKG